MKLPSDEDLVGTYAPASLDQHMDVIELYREYFTRAADGLSPSGNVLIIDQSHLLEDEQ